MPSRACTWSDEAGKFDEVVEDKGVKLIVEPRALMHVLGTTVDFIDERLKYAPTTFVSQHLPGTFLACGSSGTSLLRCPAWALMPREDARGCVLRLTRSCVLEVVLPFLFICSVLLMRVCGVSLAELNSSSRIQMRRANADAASPS